MVGAVHIGLAAGVTLLMVSLADAPIGQKGIAVLSGLALGACVGWVTAAGVERRVDRRGGLVLYAEDTAPYAVIWLLALLALSPAAFGVAILRIADSPTLQHMLQLAMCSVAAAWLAHDMVLARGLRRASCRGGPLQVQWFHGRSVTGPEAMIGRSGELVGTCAPTGYVRIRGELWQAESIDGSTLPAGQTVTVRRLNGLILLVEATGPTSATNPGARRSSLELVRSADL
jgi:membrane protein implicated in regulation of membrane protease activity